MTDATGANASCATTIISRLTSLTTVGPHTAPARPPTGDFEDALRQADATEYGLQAAVFTRDISRVFQAVRRLNFGGVIINDTPVFRADHMPYGGMRRSGIGREGVRYAMEEMTNIQMVVIRLAD